MTRVTFPRLARSFDAVLETAASADVDLIEAVTDFARHHLASPKFDVAIVGDHVLVSSLARAGTSDAGDFGVGHVVRDVAALSVVRDG